jgi:hypothetical protein
VINEKEKRRQFLSLITNALSEMKEQQTVLLKRGDLFRERERELFKSQYHEIKDILDFVKHNGSVEKGYRHLQMNVFMKHESFFMNLFETQKFPILFELFEFE